MLLPKKAALSPRHRDGRDCAHSGPRRAARSPGAGEASRELAGRIPGAELVMYEGLGHGLYEEAPDFLDRVAEFCR